MGYVTLSSKGLTYRANFLGMVIGFVYVGLAGMHVLELTTHSSKSLPLVYNCWRSDANGSSDLGAHPI